MKLSRLLPLSALLVACTPATDESVESAASAAESAPDGVWQVLFDGSGLDRWNVLGDANWTIDGDTVRADSSSAASFLVSDLSYADFDLSLEFWVDVEANSGIFLRCQNPDQIDAESCYEVNIFDTRPDPTYGTGSIVNHSPPAAELKAGGRWNSYEITADGDSLQVTLNDVPVVDLVDSTYADGPIALQYGAGTVIFRNVQIRTR